MIKVIRTSILGRPASNLSSEHIAVLFADAIVEGRLSLKYNFTQNVHLQAIYLNHIGDIKLRDQHAC
jgi:hypothetical protein